MNSISQLLGRYRIGLLALLVNLMGAVAVCQEPDDAPDKVYLRVASFLDATNEAGADSFQNSLTRWADSLVDAPAGRISSRVETSEEKWRRLLIAEDHDLYGLYAYQFLEIEELSSLRPALLTVAEHGSSSTFLLVTRRSDQIKSVRALEGKKILIDTSGVGNLPQIWLATEISEAVPIDELSGFADMVPVSSAARALLPVYFGKADACVITRSAFKDANALNPNIIVKLHFELKSNPLLVSMFAFADHFSSVDAEKISSRALKTSASDETRRFLDLVDRKGLIPYNESAMGSTRELYDKYMALFLPAEEAESTPASPISVTTP